MANPYFNATYYLDNNPDVFAAGINTAEGAWAHYEQYGAAEALNGVASRSPAPWFDIVYYRAENPDLNTAGLTAGQLFTHFTEYGLAEGRSPSAAAEAIDADSLAAYAAANADLRTAFGIEEGEELTDAQLLQLAQHFYQFGYKENRDGAPVEFNTTPGSTFTLTTGVDDLVGTSGDDLFQAILDGGATDTLNTFDRVNGGTGTDTLLIVGDGAADIPANINISNIEIVNIETDAAVTNLNSSSFGGVKELWQVGANGAVTVGAGVTAGFRDSTTLATVTAAAGVEAVSVALDGVATAQTVTIEETTAGNVTAVTVSGEVASDGDVTIDTTATTAVEAINIALASDGTVTLAVGVDVVTTVDASGSTGDLEINASTITALESLVGGAGSDELTIASGVLTGEAVVVDGGAGNDVITVNASAPAADEEAAVSLIGGAGNDTFAIDTALANIVDVEDLEASLITIEDFSAGDDVLSLAGFTRDVLVNTELAEIAAADSLEDALDVAASYTTNNQFSVFDYDGDAYILFSTDAEFANGDGLIKVVGFSVAEITAENFVSA